MNRLWLIDLHAEWKRLRDQGRKRKWDYYTKKIILLLDPVTKTTGSMQLIWAKHASDLMKKRDRYAL